MGLGELLLQGEDTTHEGSFVGLYLSGDGNVSQKELALDVSNDCRVATKILVRSHVEAFLAVEQEQNRRILRILHSVDLLEVALNALKPEILVLGLELNVEFLENLGPDG